MIVHKLLIGDNAGKYLPFAFSRLRALQNIDPKGYFTQRFIIDGYVVSVKQVSDVVKYIWIVGTGETYFEFQTSGFPIDIQSISAGGVSYSAYNAGIIGVHIKEGVATATLLGGKRTLFGAEASRIKRGQQVILLDEPVHYYSAEVNAKSSQNYSRMLYDSYAPVGPHTGIHYHDYHAFFQIITSHTFLGSATSHFIRDVGYDQIWNDNTDFGALRPAAVTDSTDDWPRMSGLQKVISETYGTREFAINVDAFDQVSVFPTASIDAPLSLDNVPLQNVDPTVVKRTRVTFPAWVFKKTVTFKSWYAAHSGGTSEEATGLYDFPEIDWKMHPDGTKMCAVVYERVTAELNTAYFSPFATDISTQGPGTFYPDATSFNLMNAVTMGVDSLHGGALSPGDTYYMSGTGLLEVTIEIVLTGFNPQDFTLTLTTTEVRRPTTSAYCTFFAGYSWYDVKSKTSTDEVPDYDARRGDLCVLDIECYGRLSDGKAASLYSLKDLTLSKEIRTFGGSSTFTSGALYSGIPSVVAYNFETLSFVFKNRNEVTTGSSPARKDLYFGLSVFTNNRYRYTFFPDTMPDLQKTAITAIVDQNDHLAIAAELGVLSFMPLNDLRDWTDDTMRRLREYYCRSGSEAGATVYGAYAGNPQPYANPDISDFGYKYWKTGAFEFSPPTADMYHWYNDVVRHGLLKPYVLFDLTEPRPGWWQHMGQLTQRCEINSHTTFFTHPNGTWALFNQSYIYNGNGIHIVNIGDAGLGTAEWNPLNMEHCIFDKVHFSIWTKDGNTALESTFRSLYNQAITNGQDANTLTDESKEVSLANMRASFTLGTIVDPYDAAVSYAQMQLTWPPGYTAYYKELGYFTGTKLLANGFDARMIGGALDLSLAALWKYDATEGSAFIYPDLSNLPVTFSTCVLITKV